VATTLVSMHQDGRFVIGGLILKLKAFAASIAAFTMLATSANAAELVTNGDFGAGIAGWTAFTTGNGALGPGFPQVVSFDVTGLGAQSAAQFQVGQVVFNQGVQEGGGLRQTITTTAGSLSFFADIAAQEANQAINGSGGLFRVFLDGIALDTFNFGEIGAGEIERASLSFDAEVIAGDHTLEILMTRGARTGVVVGRTPFQFVTNVSATQADSVVPEPSTWALLILGFGAAGLSLRERKARTT
jgi:hypothetical protein